VRLVVHVDGGSRETRAGAGAAVISSADGELLAEASELLASPPTTSPSTAGCCSRQAGS